jgi:hypothetical protein
MKKIALSTLAAALLFTGCATTTTQAPIAQKNCFDKERLEARELRELQNAKNSLLAFKNEYQEMSSYITFLNEYVADYSKYINAASQASFFIKLMPIPYAGQISSAAGFGAKMTTLAANASKSMVTLSGSIKTFEAKLAAYEADKNPASLEDAQKFANSTLNADIAAAEQNLTKLKEGTASMLAVSAAIKEYYESTGDAISKAASMFAKKDEQKKTPNDKALKAKNDGFDQRLVRIFAGFDTAKNHIKNGSLIRDLRGEL